MQSDHPDLVEVLLVRRHHDPIAHRLHDQVVHAPVDLQRRVEQPRIDVRIAACSPLQDRGGRSLELVQRRVVGASARSGAPPRPRAPSRNSNASWISVTPMSAIWMPRCGISRTRLSASSRFNASRVGPSGTSSSAHSSPCETNWPGDRLRLKSSRLEALVGDLAHQRLRLGLAHASRRRRAARRRCAACQTDHSSC